MKYSKIQKSILKKNFTTVLKNFQGGNFHQVKGNKTYQSINPATQEVISLIPETSKEEFNTLVANSKEAFKAWRNVPLLTRQRYVADMGHALRQKSNEIAKIITMEHGKTFPDALGEVQRGLEVFDQASNISHVYQGETLENIASHTDNYSYRAPLGVVAGICPFNFPFMIPCWMISLGIATGNTYVLKPSEKVANSTDFIANIAKEVGLPAGVLNVVHGGHDQVTNICTHPDIKAISFVGGNNAGEYIYETGSKNGKRVQSNMGAKNHAIVLEDADKEDALNALVNASLGAAGQRCMATSVAIMVGKVSVNLLLLRQKIGFQKLLKK